MFELVSLYGPHEGVQASLRLWRKLDELHRQGKNVLFLGVESSAARRKNEPALQKIVQEDREHIQRQLRIHDKRVQDLRIGPEALSIFGETLGAIPKDPKAQHGLFTHVVAGLHDLPLHEVEYVDKKRAKKIRRLFRAYDGAEKRLFQMVQQRESVEQILGQARRYFFDAADMNLSRHKEVVKNLQGLMQDPRYKQGGVVVLQFGRYHAGLETYLENELVKKGIKIRARKPEQFGVTPSLWEELLEKRMTTPRFKPSDEEIARGILHFFIRSGNEPAVVQKCEGIIRKMPLEKVREALTHLIKQNAAEFNALMAQGRRR